MASISLKTHLEYDKVALGKTHIVHMLVELEGQKIKVERPPLSLSAVIDVSGSMQGHKLEYAKMTLRKLVENMSSQDTLSGVAFSDQVYQVFPAMKMTQENKETAYRAIDGLQTMGSTNLSGGMLEGFNQLKDEKNELVRVFLMTDGQANVGVVAKPSILKMVEGRPAHETLSTFGYGADHDVELLQSMAKTGKGNFYFIENPDQCGQAFGRELGGLLTCAAQAIKVKVTTKPDVKILEVLSDFDVVADDKNRNEATITVDDVYSEERRRILLKLELPVMDKSGRPFKLGDVVATFQDLQAHESREESTKVEIEYVKEDEAQKDPSKAVQEELGRLAAVKAQQTAYQYAAAGNYVMAAVSMGSAINSLKNIGTVQSAAMADDLEGNVLDKLSASKFSAGGAQYVQGNVAAYTRSRSSTEGTSKLFGTSATADMASAFVAPPASVTQVPAQTSMIVNTPPPPLIPGNQLIGPNGVPFYPNVGPFPVGVGGTHMPILPPPPPIPVKPPLSKRRQKRS
jgi:Ca-activated chloride channel family protein